MLKPQHVSARDLLAQGMTHFERRLHRRLIAETLRRFTEFQAAAARGERQGRAAAGNGPDVSRRPGIGGERRRPENAAIRGLVDFFRTRVRELLDTLTAISARHAEFRRNVSRGVDQDEARQLLLDYAAELGANWWQRLGDRRALKRWLSDDALNDRCQRQLGELELELRFVLDRFAVVVDRLIGQISRPSEVAGMWERLGVEPLVHDALEYSGDRRVRTAAMQCLAKSLSHVQVEIGSQLVGYSIESRVQRLATDPTADLWLQSAALDVLARIDEERFSSVVAQRLMRPAAGDDLFLRRHCLRRIVEHVDRFADKVNLWDQVVQDPSPAVRQQAAATLWQLPLQVAWPRLARLIADDPCPQVRAAALRESLAAISRGDFRAPFLRLLVRRLEVERDAFCLRVALFVAVHWLRKWFDVPHNPQADREVQQSFREHVRPAIWRIQTSAADVPMRRWAAAAAEQLGVLLDPAARQLQTQLVPLVQSLPRGRTRRIPNRLLRGLDHDTIGRTLAVVAQDDFGIELIRGLGGYRLTKQPQFGFRLWRAWTEFRRPATDKRQAHCHTVGRIPRGDIRAPSRIMGELSATKVPGEPLVVAADGTWRPFLPLLDDFVSALNQNLILPRPTRLYSSEGVTEIQVSRNPLRRLSAALRLITQFPALAELRNWDPSSSQRPDKYLQAMQRVGFRVKFRPYDGRDGDSSATQFFPALLAFASPGLLPLVQEWVKDYAYYFSSAFENSLAQLVVFTATVLVLFLGKHAVSNLQIWFARRRVPLSIGGWGTRGKSGTERLKAALLNASGHGLVSKTTGCEAMFIHAPPSGEPLEIPLYRPGDKATIWEQSNLLRLAAGMRPSAFLWECMALTPDYVDVLQQQWMHDDLATITNTYPDHEDLQGPSGMDVATTITGFVPRRSHLLTTEQQMLPLVRDRCRQRQTTLRGVGWLESGLITDDLLDRFPYREHPDNIALVAALAEELGYSYDFAVKAMADHLIPDLGVLKTHPVAHLQASALEFTNGMSANERFGCLGNWKRLAFDRHDPRQEPAIFISTVVNNRADRVARSRVFASVLVNDLQADRHFLIGGNLSGLQGFIWEAWEEYAQSVSLCREGGQWDVNYARETVQQLARRFRVPTADDEVRATLRIMLGAAMPNLPSVEASRLVDELGTSPQACAERLQSMGVTGTVVDRLTRHLQQLLQGRQEISQLLAAVEAVKGPDVPHPLTERLRNALKEWFARKLVVIENYDATGDEIIQRIIDETPPAFLNRVMGIQNIKGTGLDFVYRFHAWDTCHQACRALESGDQDARAAALNSLAALPEYGLLCQEKLQPTLEGLRHASPPLPAALQIQLEEIQQKLAANIQASLPLQERQGSPAGRTANPWVAWGLNLLEQWMEVHDAVRRRKHADQIYRDLQRERISRPRAVEELRRLNKRQKGGWLAQRFLGSHD